MVALVGALVILMVVIIVMRDRAAKQHRIDAETILINSNQWQQAEAKLRDEKEVNTQLSKDLKAQQTAVVDLSNSLSQISGKLKETEATLTSAQGAVQQKITEISKRDEQIAELERQNRTLDEHAAELASAITMLTSQIGDTEQKLAAHSGDKVFLVKELKRLLTEKAELERQFNDLKALRLQLAKVKEGVNVSRRLQWARKGLSSSTEQKGASLLMQGGNRGRDFATTTNYDLNVEVKSDGSSRIVPVSPR